MLEYKLIKATPTLIKTPNCLDDIMATLFEKYHIDYIKFYSQFVEARQSLSKQQRHDHRQVGLGEIVFP